MSETLQQFAQRQGEYSVCQFFVDGGYEYVTRWVGPQTAVETFMSCCRSVGARIGATVRVIITDGGDCINEEWKFGEGITYPPQFAGIHP